VVFVQCPIYTLTNSREASFDIAATLEPKEANSNQQTTHNVNRRQQNIMQVLINGPNPGSMHYTSEAERDDESQFR